MVLMSLFLDANECCVQGRHRAACAQADSSITSQHGNGGREKLLLYMQTFIWYGDSNHCRTGDVGNLENSKRGPHSKRETTFN